MQDHNIERPAEADQDELVALWEASVRATHHFLKEEDIVFFKPLIRNEYLSAVHLYVLKNDGAFSGFIGIKDYSIEMLFIHPSQRGTGIGKALTQFAISQLKCTKVDVNEQNQQAIGFYQHMGFKTTGRSDKDGLGKPYPLLHMQLESVV
jgi:putative acetyltransferase